MHINIWHDRGEEVAAVRPRYLMRELNTRSTLIIRQLQEFILMSEGSGVKWADMPFHVAESMTKRLLPTVLPHPKPISKNTGALIFLHVLPDGEIPAEAIEIEPGAHNLWPNGPVRVKGPLYYDHGIPGVIPEYAHKYNLTYGEFPIGDTNRVIDEHNIGFIEKMDAHIPDAYSLAGRGVLQLV